MRRSATRNSVSACAASPALIAHALLPRPVLVGELVKPTLDFHDVRVVVSYVSTGELVNLHKKYGAHRETGARTCEIYLPNAKRPREVDDEATLILGHELLHCMRGDYHR